MPIFYRYTIHVFLMLFMSMIVTNVAVASPKKMVADAVVYVDDSVHCDAYSMVPLDKVTQLLADGAIVSASWQFNITRERDYWVDTTVSQKELIHQVTPDLIAGRWILLDIATGITSTTRSLHHALQFLLTVENISLITHQDIAQWKIEGYSPANYAIHIRLHISDGIVAPTGWRAWLRLGKTVAVRNLALP